LRLLIFFLLFINFATASYIQEDVWWKGETLLTFFKKHHIPKELYFDLSKTDKELCSEINAGVKYQTLYDTKSLQLEQSLIPISEEMQIHIFQDINKHYKLDIIPIKYDTITQTIFIPITSSPYADIVRQTNNRALANSFMLAFKKTVNFKRLRKTDIIVIKFKQKIRNGRYFGTPDILGAMITVRGKHYYIFKNSHDDRYYDNHGKSLTSVNFIIPLRYKRISSYFTYKRWHPILHRYRAHLGIDFAAPSGRKVWATSDGKIIHRGKKGGYGNAIIIRHKNGYKSLYAHLSRFNKKIHVGSWVKQGDYIGNVGTTGRSTGPHLHFGIYKRGRAINPLKLIKNSRKKLKGKILKKYRKQENKIKKELLRAVKEHKKPLKLIDFKNSCKINI